MANIIETSTFTDKQQTQLKKTIGKFLYYARAIDNTMMHALNDLASQITIGAMKTEMAIEFFLNYRSTYPNAANRASNTMIRCDADANYIVAPKVRSRAGGYIYMGNRDNNIQIINAPIMIIATILKMAVGLAAEAELAALYHCAQVLVPLRQACI